MAKVGKFAALAFAGAAALVAAAPSQAATFNNFSTATGTGGFGNTNTANGSFSDTFNFTVAAPGGILATYVQNLSSTQLGDIDFLTAVLSGPSFASPVSYSFTATPFVGNPDGNEQGTYSFGNLAAGVYTLVVSGSAGNIASYTGDFTVSAAVPEPATWALMIGGMGLAGGALRRRRSVAAKAVLA